MKTRSLLKEAYAAFATGLLFAATAAALILMYSVATLWWTDSRHHHLSILDTVVGAASDISVFVLAAAFIVDRLRWSYHAPAVASATYVCALAAYCFTVRWDLVSGSDIVIWTLPLLCLVTWAFIRALRQQSAKDLTKQWS